MERIVAASSKPGDTVLDVFDGSSSTALACRKLGRHFVGCERDPETVKAAKQRLEVDGIANDFPRAAELDHSHSRHHDESHWKIAARSP